MMDTSRVPSRQLSRCQEARSPRQVFEARLGHYLADHPWVKATSADMAQACWRYLLVRAKSRAAASDCSIHHALTKILRPVQYPFSGRLRNAKELVEVLRGGGSVREQQCSIWMFFSTVLAEDLVGRERHPGACDFAAAAGLNPAVLATWVAQALDFKSGSARDEVTVATLDPRLDFLRMDWHSIRRLQLETRSTYSQLHQNHRFWSLKSRRAFLEDGGRFSTIEMQLTSPLGPDRVPWFDTKRFFRPNEASKFVEQARRLHIPLLTGISGVGMHTFQFAKSLGMRDMVGVRLVALGYLMALELHSYFEVMLSELDEAPSTPPLLEYAAMADLDWNEVEERCGPVPL